jgi:glutamate racemase
MFDSGVGGLSVLRAVRAELPAEDVVYVADSGYAPYGDRSRHDVEERAVAVAGFLLGQAAKAIVIACNTATGAAAETLRERFAVPIVAMEPAVKPAAARTRSGVVGVLATAQTLSSARFLKLVDRHTAGARVLLQPCPGLVEQVERGELTGAATRDLVERYVRPLLQQGADTLVLGCTHYPLLRPLVEEAAGAGVEVIDPAVAVARELRRRLAASGLLRDEGRPGTETFWSSGDPATVERVVEQLWRADARVAALPERPRS